MKSKDFQLGSSIYKINERGSSNTLHWTYSETRPEEDMKQTLSLLIGTKHITKLKWQI